MFGLFRVRHVFLIVTFSISGCSIHPDIEDVTELPVFDVVQRIQCEAAESLRAAYAARGHLTTRGRLQLIDADIRLVQARLKTIRTGLEFERGEELADAIHATNIQIFQLQAKITKLLAGDSTATDGEKADDHYGKALYAEGRRLLDQKKSLEAQRIKFDAAKSAEQQLKKYSDQRGQFAGASAFESHLMVFQFQFQITENNNAAVSAGSAVWPIALGTFTLGFETGERKKRVAVRNVKLAQTFGELLFMLDCTQLKAPGRELVALKYPITGTIGLDRVLDDYLRAAAVGKFKTGGESYTDRIQFTTKINATLKPQVDLIRKVPAIVKVQGELTADREDLHELTVFLSPAEANRASAAGAELIIKKIPDLRVRSLDVQPPL